MKQTKPTRRQFLRNTLTTGAAAGWAITHLPSTVSGQIPSASETVRIGLIGCGGRGSGAVASALAMHPGAKLTAMADAFPDRLQGSRKVLQKKFDTRIQVEDSRCFSGFDAYEKLIDSGIDVALMAEPPHFRPAHIEACVDAGVHVFAEKPMAVDVPGVHRVLAAGEKARRHNLSFVTGFETRYSDISRDAVKRIHDGQIGDIVAIEGVYNTGPLWHRGRKPEWTEMEFQMRNWYYFTWLSGDHIVEQHVHYLDFASWLMGEKPPLDAWGYGGRSVRVEPKYGDIFDHHSVVYEYEKGTRVYALTRQQPRCFNGVYRTVFGTKGQLRLSRNKKQSGIFNLDGKQLWQPGSASRHAELNTFQEMFNQMKDGPPVNDSLTMARSTMLAILGRMATHSGQRITWEQAFASKMVLAPDRYTWDADPPVLPRADGSYPHPIPGVTQVL